MGKTVTAVVVAAGSSSRMGFDKLACPLGGGTVLGASLAAFPFLFAASVYCIIFQHMAQFLKMRTPFRHCSLSA